MPGDLAVEFLLRFTRYGHRAGYATADLEERVLSLAEVLGLQGAEISATPTLVEISLGSIPHQRSYTLRVRPTPVDLDAIARLDDLVRDTLDRQIDAPAALARLADIEARPLRRRWYVRLAAYSLAGAAVTPVLGGGWRDLFAGGVVGLVVGVVVIRGAASCARGADDRAARRGCRELLRGRAGLGSDSTRHPTS